MNEKIIAMIPARFGSTRLKMKNLAILNKKPLIYYAIKAAKDSGIFDQIVLNSDHQIFEAIAHRYEVDFYKRPEELGSSKTKSDEVVMDFVKKNPCQIIVWVNPTSPLQTSQEIGEVVKFFQINQLDSLFTVQKNQVHCVYKDQPINYDTGAHFAQTQDLIPVQSFVYSIMMWRTHVFKKHYAEKGYALFCGKTGFYPVCNLSSVIIKKENDLKLAEYILQTMDKAADYKVKYDAILENKGGEDE